MNKLILFLFFFLILSLSGYSQDLDNFSSVPPIKKGKIILTDGTVINFKKFSILNDSVSLTNTQSISCTYYKKDIYKLSITGNYGIAGALSGGIGALIGAVIGTNVWESDPGLSEYVSTYIIGATLAGTVISGIVGLCIKKDKIVFKSSKPLSLDTRFEIIGKNKPAFLMTAKINL